MVTAAHCVHNEPKQVWTVAVGEQDSTGFDESEQFLKAEHILIHELYQYPNFTYDLALIQLEEPILWTKYAQPVCLPDRGRDARGLGYLAGWGFDNEIRRGGNPTESLHMAKLPIVENDKCEEWFHSRGKMITLLPEHLCAGHEFGNEDGCQVGMS